MTDAWLEPAAGETAVVRRLRQMGLSVGPARDATLRWYDTFDWGLWRAGVTLVHEAGEEGWLTWAEGDDPPRWRIPLDDPPASAADLPTGPLADAVAKRAGVRALLVAGEAHRRSRAATRVQGDRPVARAVVETWTTEPDRSGPTTLVRIEGLPGEEDAAADLLDDLTAEGWTRAVATPFEAAVAARHRVPGVPSGKLDVSLDPHEPAGRGVRTVLAHLLDTMRINEAGLIDAVDTEFLHDYRVALRRSRAIAASCVGALGPSVLERFGEELKWLGGVTSPLRDLDVQVLDLPADARADEAFAPLAAELRRRQRAAHRSVVRALASPRYQRLLAGWSAALADPATPDDAPHADVETAVYAAGRIRKAARRVRRDGRRLDHDSPGEAFHDLRKRAKRLRYLLECFQSALGPDRAKALISQLKGLQDNLGEHQDQEVQAATLRSLADDLLASGRAGAPTVMAMGVEVARLEKAQIRSRDEFAERFAAFDDPHTRALIDDLVENPFGS